MDQSQKRSLRDGFPYSRYEFEQIEKRNIPQGKLRGVRESLEWE